jgi:ATP-binding cassette subfamily B protein
MNVKRRIPYFKVITSTIVHCWHAHPTVFIGLMLASTVLCAIQIGELFAMRYLFDTVAGFIEGYLLMGDVFTAAVPMAVLLITSPLVNIAEYIGQGYFWRRGSGYLMARYHERIQRIPLIDFEKSETFDQMKKARIGSEDAPSAGRTIVQITFHFIPYLMFTAVFLFSIKPLLVAALFVIFVSVLFAQILRAKIVRRFEEENASLRRQTEYLESCVTGKEYVKETRTFGAVGYFFGLFLDSAKRFSKASVRTERKIAGIELLLRFVNSIGYAGILALLVYYVMEGSISVGAFASVFYSVECISGVLEKIVEYCGGFFTEIGTASFTHEFLNVDKDEGKHTVLNKKSDIFLENISFVYPNGETVLDGITLTIKQGETLAIVGENGAGKTTLTKLILGLYKPTSGTIQYGGNDISDYINTSRFSLLSSVFQNFIRYKLTVKENIEISDVEAQSDVEQAAIAAGVQFTHLPNGLETTLSREFGGTELSGGEWQRIAIARGLYRKYDVIVLDEPTASIDPIEESNIFRLFKESAKDKTAILVTHRLGSTKIADRILLMEDGTIRELGSHEQLIEQNGKYARMYREQSSWYER